MEADDQAREARRCPRDAAVRAERLARHGLVPELTLPLRRNRDFVLLQAGQLLSAAGTQSTTIAYPLLVLALTGSPARAGIVTFARIVPSTIFALPAGVAADRVDRRRMMIAADAVRAVAIATLVAAILAGR